MDSAGFDAGDAGAAAVLVTGALRGQDGVDLRSDAGHINTLKAACKVYLDSFRACCLQRNICEQSIPIIQALVIALVEVTVS